MILVIIVESLSSTPSATAPPAAFLSSVITVTDLEFTVVVFPATAARAFKFSNDNALFVILGVPVPVDLNVSVVVNVDVAASNVAAAVASFALST